MTFEEKIQTMAEAGDVRGLNKMSQDISLELATLHVQLAMLVAKRRAVAMQITRATNVVADKKNAQVVG